ncbi:hypothetical protein BN1723_012803 [Verticillium longisporum]|uniref:A to I editase domain-containing protein n=1 Tax=Verticillium longisporum TaxID=100787 RepID=A0A0G4LMI3_VERLO|nr:tRNA-specific adenosine deaminase 1 like protein [Verticillium longisporum]CRK22865.1 hypothetical protein BN1723_012803 [Verticillium longisporum]
MTVVDPDLIADAVFEKFRQLPARRKPQVRDNGVHEWVPLSGIVAAQNGTLTCLAVATGMKCLPASKIPQANGIGLHDWHAEILVLRAFNRFLLSACHQMLLNKSSELGILRYRTDEQRGPYNPQGTQDWEGQPFAIADDVRLYMYCSEAPCGDASMELTMATQEDASPWDAPVEAGEDATTTSADPSMPGRGFFSQLGIVRRKPARADAPPTLSKSCSDKMAIRQCTSILSSLTALFIHPGNAYIDVVVLPQSQYSVTGCQRSFSSEGRMSALKDKTWAGGYAFHPFHVETTAREFENSKRAVEAKSGTVGASNLAAAWNANGLNEGLIGGVLQGRRAFDIKGASSTSRRQMWTLARETASLLHSTERDLRASLSAASYADIKAGELSLPRRTVVDQVRSESLTGWAENTGDDSFALDSQ